jgi:hypothetical protein
VDVDDLGLRPVDQVAYPGGRVLRPDRHRGGADQTKPMSVGRGGVPHVHLMAALDQKSSFVVDDTVFPRRCSREVPRMEDEDAH